MLKLRPVGEPSAATAHAYHNYALLLDLLRRASPELATRVHNADSVKPVTASARQGGKEPWIRFSFLTEPIFAHLAHAVQRTAADAPVTLGGDRFEIIELATHPKASPWARCDDFARILERAGAGRSVTLRFHSATAFRSSGRNIVLPQPELVFGSLIARWNAYSDITIPDATAEELLAGLVVSGHNLGTRLIDFGTYRQIGFVGKCTFELKGKPSPDAVRALNALADFAFYSGVGAKTTMGMGQTRLVRERKGGADSG